MLVLTIVARLAPHTLIRFFTKEPSVVAFGGEYLSIIALNFVASGLVSVIDAIEIELPLRSAIEGGFDGNAVAHPPAESFRQVRAGDRALPVFDEVIPLVIRHHKLRVDPAMVLHVNHELWKEILFINRPSISGW